MLYSLTHVATVGVKGLNYSILNNHVEEGYMATSSLLHNTYLLSYLEQTETSLTVL